MIAWLITNMAMCQTTTLQAMLQASEHATEGC